MAVQAGNLEFPRMNGMAERQGLDGLEVTRAASQQAGQHRDKHNDP